MSNKDIYNPLPSDKNSISFGFPIPYSGKAPSEARPANSEEEAQRIKAIKILRQNAVEIKEAAREFNVTPEAIAGAILWEACENPQPSWRNSGIPGKMHDYEALNIYNENSKIPRGWTPTKENLRVPKIAIVYIAAQMEYHSNVYRKVAKVEISSNSAVLATLYNTGDSLKKAMVLRDKRAADLKAGRPLTQPRVPERAMGEYIQKYNQFIMNQLNGINLDKTTFSRDNNSAQESINQDGSKKSTSIAEQRVEAITSELEKAGISSDSGEFSVAFKEVVKHLSTLTNNEKKDILEAQGFNSKVIDSQQRSL
jgi:Protein of unknown function (DUF1402)